VPISVYRRETARAPSCLPIRAAAGTVSVWGGWYITCAAACPVGLARMVCPVMVALCGLTLRRLAVGRLMLSGVSAGVNIAGGKREGELVFSSP
jgi:hypothetical protein